MSTACYSALVQYLDGLNEQQRDAVLVTDGPLMILAGAGAGKTKTITHRIAHLIATGVPSDAILAVTFTNKAAGEMRERVANLLGAQTSGPISPYADRRLPFVATFHSLGVRILRENASRLGLPRSFSIWDRADSVRAVKNAMKDLGIEKQYEPKNVLGRISKTKGEGLTYRDFVESARTSWEQTVAAVWEKYEAALSADHALDFDDLLLRTLRLLQEHAEVRVAYRKRWTHLTVDEYQDTNGVQYEILRQLAGDACNVCVVGDIDQNIYSWRGADINHLLSFEKVFPNTKVVLLEQNYRSTKTILAAANEVIAKNQNRFDKKLFTEGAAGDPIVVFSALGEIDEAQFVAQAAGEHIRQGVRPSEIAVLYRANFQSRALEEAFLASGISYRVLGTRFFERREVKDAISYLRAALNPQSRADIARIVATPPRGIGKATLMRMLEGEEDKLAPAARKKVGEFRELLANIAEHARTKKVSETLRFVIGASGLEAHLAKDGDEGAERLENLRELVTLATRYDQLEPLAAAEKLIEDAALASEQDSLEQKGESVSLMTVHASKGLEFDVVFITGLEDGLFPHERFDDESTDTEEERRLFYVALTRARKQVYLTHAATRMMYGNREITIPSEFLSDIAPEHRIDLFAEEPEAREAQHRKSRWDWDDEPSIV